MRLIKKMIIKASSTADLTYFDEQLKHSYFDLAKSKKTDLVWSMRVGLVLVDGKYNKFIDLYLACTDESVGSTDGDFNIIISREESFVDAYFKGNLVNESLSSYKNENPTVVCDTEIISYLKLWDELYCEFNGRLPEEKPTHLLDVDQLGDFVYIENVTPEVLKSLILSNDKLKFKHQGCCLVFCSEGDHLYAQDVKFPESDAFGDGDFLGAIGGYYNTTTYVISLLESLALVGLELELSDNMNTFNMPLSEIKHRE